MVWAGLMWSNSSNTVTVTNVTEIFVLLCWSPAPSLLTWSLTGALLLHPAVVGGAVSIAGQGDGGSGDADAGLSVLVVPDPTSRKVGGPASLGQLAHCA